MAMLDESLDELIAAREETREAWSIALHGDSIKSTNQALAHLADAMGRFIGAVTTELAEMQVSIQAIREEVDRISQR